MTTTASAYDWAITDIGTQTTTPHRAGRATTHAAAWTAALRAGRTALLAGELDTLAVTIGDQHCGALYTGVQRVLDPDPAAASVCAVHNLIGLRIWSKRRHDLSRTTRY